LVDWLISKLADISFHFANVLRIQLLKAQNQKSALQLNYPLNGLPSFFISFAN